MAHVSIEISGHLDSFQIWHGKTFSNFAHCLRCQSVNATDINILRKFHGPLTITTQLPRLNFLVVCTW